MRSLELWWTGKEYEEHRAHMAFYTPPLEANPFSEPSLVQRVAAILPGIGNTRSEAVAEHFGSVREMVSADAKVWADVKGVGKITAKKVVAAMEGK